uniref:Heterogeneous nuclear ribonucleoprotein K n=1 Tax=Aceria tosichella TaxID=561515 RepID=A0A6G1SLT1_9ACAR
MLVHMNTDDEHRRDNQVAQEEEGEGEGTCSAAANSLRPTQREEQSSQQAIVERLDVESMTSAAKPETDTSSQAITTSESSADRALGGGEDQRNERAPEELVAERGYKEQELESGCSRASETIITSTQKRPIADKRIDVRLLVRRREAGALIGKRGANIKRMRETYNTSTFNIPDTGNGPERIVCISANNWESAEAILLEIGQLFLDKSSLTHQDEEQVELKQLINSAYAGLLIGIGGQSIRKLRNDSRAAIKIYEMCCPQSEERVCAIKARPPVVVSTIRAIYEIMLSNQTTIKAPLQANKPYDALNFDLNLVDKYGGFVPDECCPNIELMDQLRSNNSAIEGPNSSQLQHYHHRPNIQPPNHHHHPHQLEHFDLMLASGGGGEPLPLVMPPHTPGFRPAAFLAPFQQIDFVPFHPVGECPVG